MSVLNGFTSKLQGRSRSKAGDECFGHITMHTSRLGNSANYGLQVWAACENGFSRIFGSRQLEMCKCSPVTGGRGWLVQFFGRLKSSWVWFSACSQGRTVSENTANYAPCVGQAPQQDWSSLSY